jgi:hypothetical protein
MSLCDYRRICFVQTYIEIPINIYSGTGTRNSVYTHVYIHLHFPVIPDGHDQCVLDEID